MCVCVCDTYLGRSLARDVVDEAEPVLPHHARRREARRHVEQSDHPGENQRRNHVTLACRAESSEFLFHAWAWGPSFVSWGHRTSFRGQSMVGDHECRLEGAELESDPTDATSKLRVFPVRKSKISTHSCVFACVCWFVPCVRARTSLDLGLWTTTKQEQVHFLSICFAVLTDVNFVHKKEVFALIVREHTTLIHLVFWSSKLRCARSTLFAHFPHHAVREPVLGTGQKSWN